MKVAKSAPIHSRLDDEEARFLTEMIAQTGLSPAEVVRRAMRLLRKEVEAKDRYLILDLVA